MKTVKIALVIGWLALCAWVFWSVYSARESVWHVSESAQLEPIPRALDDDGSWPTWRAATVAFNAHGGEVLAGELADLLKIEGEPPVDAVEALRPRLTARLAALPDPHPMGGWAVQADPIDGSGELHLPPQSMGPARAWVAQAWLLARSDDLVGAQAALRRAHRVGVLFEHSGGSLIAVMVGVATQRLALEHAITLADRVPLDALRRDVEGARDLPSGVPAAIRGECDGVEQMLATLDPSAQAEGPGPSLPGGKLPFLYSPKRTIARHRWACRQQVAQAQARPEDREPMPHETLWNGVDPRHWIDNPVGRVMLEISGVDYARMQARRDDLGPLADQLSAAMHQRE